MTTNKMQFKELNISDSIYKTLFTKKFENRKKYIPKNEKKLLSFIPGIVKNIFVKPGQIVKKGDALLILESMKMLNKVRAPFDGKIKSINVTSDEKVPKDYLMIEFE